MTRDEERERWNATLAAHNANPAPDTEEALARAKDEVLSSIHLRVMSDDRYQGRTH